MPLDDNGNRPKSTSTIEYNGYPDPPASWSVEPLDLPSPHEILARGNTIVVEKTMEGHFGKRMHIAAFSGDSTTMGGAVHDTPEGAVAKLLGEHLRFPLEFSLNGGVDYLHMDSVHPRFDCYLSHATVAQWNAYLRTGRLLMDTLLRDEWEVSHHMFSHPSFQALKPVDDMPSPVSWADRQGFIISLNGRAGFLRDGHPRGGSLTLAFEIPGGAPGDREDVLLAQTALREFESTTAKVTRFGEGDDISGFEAVFAPAANSPKRT